MTEDICNGCSLPADECTMPPHHPLTLSQVASLLVREENARGEAAHADAGFDGGEFSGPSHHRAMMREVRRIIRLGGFATFDDFYRALVARTTPKFAYFNFAHLDDDL